MIRGDNLVSVVISALALQEFMYLFLGDGVGWVGAGGKVPETVECKQ